jgi:hypothetical protein
MYGSKKREEYDHLPERPFCCFGSAMAKPRIDLDEDAADLDHSD